jgi:hypothetical protein
MSSSSPAFGMIRKLRARGTTLLLRVFRIDWCLSCSLAIPISSPKSTEMVTSTSRTLLPFEILLGFAHKVSGKQISPPWLRRISSLDRPHVQSHPAESLQILLNRCRDVFQRFLFRFPWTSS